MKGVNFRSKKDNMMKVISLIIALLLWSYVMSEVNPTITRTFYNIPVVYRNLSDMKDKNLFLMSPEEVFIDITVKGKRKSVNEMSEKDISASIDLSNVSAGGKSMPIDVQLADDMILIDNRNPESVTLEVDEMVEKELPIEVEVSGEMSDGYILDQVTKNDEKASVRGPKTSIDSIYSLVAEVDISGRKESNLINVPIKAYDKDKNIISEVTVEPDISEVQLNIYKTKNVPIEVKLTEDIPEDFLKERVEVTPATVLLSGESKDLDKIKTITTSQISPSDLLESKTIPISLNIPEGVKLINATENFIVRYNTEDKISKSISIPTNTLKDKNGNGLPQGMKTNPAIVEVSVRGETSLISALNVEDFNLKLASGTVKLNEKIKISVEAPNGIEVLSVEPETIQLTE